MALPKIVHVFGEVHVNQSVEHEVIASVMCDSEGFTGIDLLIPSAGIYGGFEFSLHPVPSKPISSWPRIQISIGHSACMIVVPSMQGSFESKHFIRNPNFAWWNLTSEMFEIIVTLHVITES